MLKKIRNRDQLVSKHEENLKEIRNKVQIQGKSFQTQNENFETNYSKKINIKTTKIDILESLPIIKVYKDENLNTSNIDMNFAASKRSFLLASNKNLEAQNVKCKLVNFYDPSSKRSFSMPSYKESDLPFFKHKLFKSVKLKVKFFLTFKTIANDVLTDDEYVNNGFNYVCKNLKETLFEASKNQSYLNKNLTNKINFN